MLSYNLFPFFALLLSFSVADNIPLEHVHDTFLDADKNFRLTWRYNTTHIEMQATARTTGWLALGLSPDGQMDNSDVFIAWVNDTTGEVVLQDRFLVSNRTSHQIIFDIDPQQDWMLIGGKQTNNETTVTAVRALVTCDTKFDRNFTRDTLRVIWSFHPLDPADPTRIPHHSRRGSKSLLMFSQAFEVRSQMMDGNKWGEMRIGMDPIAVSNTTASSYHCSMAKLPVITSDLHITGIRPQIKSGSEPFVQQISIYLCDERVHDGSIPKDFDCGNLAVTESEKAVKNQYCRTLIAVWFSGNGEYIYPSDAGILLSKENSGRYVLVQVHYDNNRKTDFNDNSGLLLSISNEIRTRNAGILATGLLQNDYPMTVPPGTEDFVITSSCMDYCTQSTIPATGIKIFNAAVNMHAKGRKIVVRVVRGAKIIDTVLSDDNIDPGYQEARQPETEITVLPGDRLIIECHYSTAKMKTPVFGGYGMEHESCLAFLYYYPAVNLTSCGSRIIARTFLETTGYIPTLSEPTSNPSVIEPFLEDADNSSLIRTYFSTKYDWSVGNVANLQYFYNSQKQIGVCSGNNGDEQRYNFIPPYENQPQKPESCIKTTNILLPKPQTITSGTKPNSGTSDKISSAAINLANNTVHNVRVGNGTIPGTTPHSSAEQPQQLNVIVLLQMFIAFAGLFTV